MSKKTSKFLRRKEGKIIKMATVTTYERRDPIYWQKDILKKGNKSSKRETIIQDIIEEYFSRQEKPDLLCSSKS